MAINVFLAVLVTTCSLVAARGGSSCPRPQALRAHQVSRQKKAIAPSSRLSGVKTRWCVASPGDANRRQPCFRRFVFRATDHLQRGFWSVFLTVCALMFLCWKAPSLASSLLGGSPHLGVDHLIQAASAPIAAGLAAGAVASRAAAGVSATRAAASMPQGSPAAPFSVSWGHVLEAGGGEQQFHRRARLTGGARAARRQRHRGSRCVSCHELSRQARTDPE